MWRSIQRAVGMSSAAEQDGQAANMTTRTVASRKVIATSADSFGARDKESKIETNTNDRRWRHTWNLSGGLFGQFGKGDQATNCQLF